MIAIPKEKTEEVTPAWHDGFLTMLPTIRRHATIAFRELDDEASEEAVQEVICNAMRAYVRLAELGKTNVAYRERGQFIERLATAPFLVHTSTLEGHNTVRW